MRKWLFQNLPRSVLLMSVLPMTLLGVPGTRLPEDPVGSMKRHLLGQLLPSLMQKLPGLEVTSYEIEGEIGIERVKLFINSLARPTIQEELIAALSYELVATPELYEWTNHRRGSSTLLTLEYTATEGVLPCRSYMLPADPVLEAILEKELQAATEGYRAQQVEIKRMDVGDKELAIHLVASLIISETTSTSLGADGCALLYRTVYRQLQAAALSHVKPPCLLMMKLYFSPGHGYSACYNLRERVIGIPECGSWTDRTYLVECQPLVDK